MNRKRKEKTKITLPMKAKRANSCNKILPTADSPLLLISWRLVNQNHLRCCVCVRLITELASAHILATERSSLSKRGSRLFARRRRNFWECKREKFLRNCILFRRIRLFI